ncbi:hypothetical protein ACP70R_022771 [Stipagrostis hirtigluma subsp. patula]
MGKGQQEKRQRSATGGQHAKRPRRPSQRNGVAVPAVPLHGAATNAAMAVPFPIVGVNGAAARWSTAAALGAASRAAALPQPLMVGANGAAVPLMLAPVPGLQAPDAPSNAMAPAPPTAGVNGVPAPLVLTCTAGQLVPAPIQFFGYLSTAGGFSGAPVPPAPPCAGMPLAAALARFPSTTLGRMLSALMPACHPPLRQHESRSGAPPQWWPTASERWWVPDVVAHLSSMPLNAAVPFTAGGLLKKAQKIAVLVAIVKHLSPDFPRIATAVSRAELSDTEAALWNSGLQDEHAKCIRPVFILQLQQPSPPPPQHGDGHLLQPSCSAGAEIVVHGAVVAAGVPAAIVREQAVNLAVDGGTHHSAAVIAPSEDVSHAAAAEPEPQPDQHGDVCGIDIELWEDMVVPWQAHHGEEVRQLAEHPANGGEAAGAVVAPEEAPEVRPWYENEEMRRVLADLDMPLGMGTPHTFDDGGYFY